MPIPPQTQVQREAVGYAVVVLEVGRPGNVVPVPRALDRVFR